MLSLPAHLCGVLASAISSVDDRNGRCRRSLLGRACCIVPQHNAVCICLYCPDGVCNSIMQSVREAGAVKAALMYAAAGLQCLQGRPCGSSKCAKWDNPQVMPLKVCPQAAAWSWPAHADTLTFQRFALGG